MAFTNQAKFNYIKQFYSIDSNKTGPPLETLNAKSNIKLRWNCIQCKAKFECSLRKFWERKIKCLNCHLPEPLNFVNSSVRTIDANLCGKCSHVWKKTSKQSDDPICPVCAGIILIPGINDLGSEFPQLAQQWSARNSLKPSEVTRNSKEKVYWKCAIPNHNEWETQVRSRIKNGRITRCPECPPISSIQDEGSKEEQKVLELLQDKNLKVLSDKNDKYQLLLNQRNNQTKTIDGLLEFDLVSNTKFVLNDEDGPIVAEISNIQKLLIFVEYDGELFHSDKVARDTEKTKRIINSNPYYFVVRLRVGNLNHLELKHPRLLQFSVNENDLEDSQKIAKIRESIIQTLKNAKISRSGIDNKVIVEGEEFELLDHLEHLPKTTQDYIKDEYSLLLQKDSNYELFNYFCIQPQNISEAYLRKWAVKVRQ